MPNDKSKNRKKSAPLSSLSQYLKRYKKLWIGGFICTFFSSVFAVIAPWLLKSAIDSLEGKISTDTLLVYAILILGTTIISGIFHYFMRQTFIVASRYMEYDIRNDLFLHLLKLDRQYYDRTPTGDILARTSNDLESVRMMLGPAVMYFSSTAITLVLALGLMIKISFSLTLYSMLPMPIISILVFFLGREVNRLYIKIQEQYSLITAKVQENFSGIRVVKAYVQEQAEINDFSRMNKDYIAANMKMTKIWGMFFPAIGLFAGAAIVMVLWFGGKEVMANKISLGDFVAFISYLMILIWPMAALGWVTGMYQRGRASLTRLDEMFKTSPGISNIKNPVDKEIKGKIEFRNLKFSYPARRISKDDTSANDFNGNVLNGINLIIEPGSTIAIIGDTGCGKSTIISLLTRAYNIERGMIFIDDIDINDYSLHCLRKQIVPVIQETFLFSDTIKNNISYGDIDNSPKSTIDAAEMAGIKKEVEEFPQGFDTIVGERGITLSGGQRQRATLARALASDPRLLILDDAFSSVDTHTEERILADIRHFMNSRTCIIISHRISTVKNADMIVVLKEGIISEKGKHDTLLELGGHYAQLYQRQLLQEELEVL